jgi:DNA (cytosine-5)-methyltransferase 3A
VYFDNVVSLFDGNSAGQIALRRAGITYGRYFASEVDKHAIKVTSHHFPDTIHLGDVNGVKGVDLPSVDLLIGGSPCQGFSFSGKRLNFEDPRSKLFFEFLRIRDETKPKFWMLENVVMKQEWQDLISEHLGVKPVRLNSSLVSAQCRDRLYWANFDITAPEDKGINVQDILEDIEFPNCAAIRGRGINKATILGRRLNDRGCRDDYNKDIQITQCLEVRASNTNKSNCITTVDKDNVLTPLPVGRYPDAFKNKLPFRYYTTKEYCRLQTIDDDYFDGIVSNTQARKMLGNGWTVDMIVHIFNCIPR